MPFHAKSNNKVRRDFPQGGSSDCLSASVEWGLRGLEVVVAADSGAFSLSAVVGLLGGKGARAVRNLEFQFSVAPLPSAIWP